MVEINFDEEANVMPTDPIYCMLCGGELRGVGYFWWQRGWHRSQTVHQACLERREKPRGAKAQWIPDKFAHFDGSRIDPEAVTQAAEFSPEYSRHILAVVGLPGRGKSRLVWATVKGFVDQLELAGKTARVDYFSFCELVSEYDKQKIAELKNCRYAFVDNIGSVDSFGRERASLQAAIRARLERNAWTFLSIDSLSFDPDLERQLQERALLILFDQ